MKELTSIANNVATPDSLVRNPWDNWTINLAARVPGDAAICEEVYRFMRSWWENNRPAGLAAGALGWNLTDAHLESYFGKQWQAVVNIVRGYAATSAEERSRLSDCFGGHRTSVSTPRTAIRDSALAAQVACRMLPVQQAPYDVIAGQTYGKSRTWDDTNNSSHAAAARASIGVASYHLATEDGPYTFAYRDLMLMHWVEIMGMPEGIVE